MANLPKVKVKDGKFKARKGKLKITGRFDTANKASGTVNGHTSCAPKADYRAKRFTGG